MSRQYAGGGGIGFDGRDIPGLEGVIVFKYGADEVLDDTHRDSIEAVHAIRREVNAARRRLGIPERRYDR